MAIWQWAVLAFGVAVAVPAVLCAVLDAVLPDDEDEWAEWW